MNAAKDFEIRVTSGMRNNDNFYVVRCRTDSENKRDEWIRAIDKAVAQKHRVDKASEEHRGSSLADSDDSDGDGAEDWFSRYSQTESPQRISALLEPYLDKVFQEIPTAEQVDEGVVSALYEAIRTTSFRLRARLLFCKQVSGLELSFPGLLQSCYTAFYVSEKRKKYSCGTRTHF